MYSIYLGDVFHDIFRRAFFRYLDAILNEILKQLQQLILFYIILVFVNTQSCIVFGGQLEYIFMVTQYDNISFIVIYFGTCQRPLGVFNQSNISTSVHFFL